MRIGIDARLWSETGVGRYIRALVEYLPQLDSKNEYVIFLREREYADLELPNEKWQKKLANVSWHSLEEQLKLPEIYAQAHLDLVHIPYFSVPIFIRTPYVVTIHDLTISHFPTGLASTKSSFNYWFKYVGYRAVLGQAVRKARKIITVSEAVKKQIRHDFNLPTTKIAVTYESGELETGKATADPKMPQKYLLYVGNAYPHKNLSLLIEAFFELRQKFTDLSLVLIGKDDFFYQRLQKQVKGLGLEKQVLFPGSVANGELINWYKRALALVFPSLAEGFGIPGLEAMSLGCPVAASDLVVFREIYAEAVLYFDPKRASSIKDTVDQLIGDEELRRKLITAGKMQAKKYTWEKMTAETIKIYETSAGI